MPESLFYMSGDKGSNLGTGGMKTKLSAAKICVEKGVDMVIANGENPKILYDVVTGKLCGYTRFFAK